jgi:glutathione S-transferase
LDAPDGYRLPDELVRHATNERFVSDELRRACRVAGGEPRLLPEYRKTRAYGRIWMASADHDFYPAVFEASVGRERGFSEERVSEALDKLETVLSNSSACPSWRGGVGSFWRTFRTFGRGWSGWRAGKVTRRPFRSRYPVRYPLARPALSRPSGSSSDPPG